MSYRQRARYVVHSATAANGIGKTIEVRDFQWVTLAIATAGTATLTAKIQGAMDNPSPAAVGVQTVPDFSLAATAANPWTFINSTDLDSGSLVAGATGYSAAAADIVKLVRVNCQNFDFLNVQISGRSAGTLNVWAVAFDNQ